MRGGGGKEARESFPSFYASRSLKSCQSACGKETKEVLLWVE